MSELVGIDTGGTFTDFILYKNGSFVTYKIPSTPKAPQQAILEGLKFLEIELASARLVHGTTVATNALLEGKGAATAFITNRGFKDILHIGRQSRQQLYSLSPQATRQLIPRDLCFEVGGRIDASGEIHEDITEQDITSLKDELQSSKAEAVAICMLFSFLNQTHEIAIEEALKADYFLTRSSAILPEQREYERAIVTWLNSYLGPLTQGYLKNLQQTLSGGTIHVMQSDATTLPATRAGTQAVRLLLSGPAGGLAAASAIASESGHQQLLTLDMGGTSTDVALIDKQAKFTNEGKVAEFPLAISMLDIHTIGAGGGSIARVDEAGGLHVGPESAGADPGPACYDRGGALATITDANVVLGRLPITHTWSSGITLDRDKAFQAMALVAKRLNCTVTEAAKGVISLADAHMVEALRVISIHRGYNPGNFSLFPFGGAGGMHMCAVAEALKIKTILIPKNAGILSAQGMLYAPVGETESQSFCKYWTKYKQNVILNIFKQLKAKTQKKLSTLGLTPNREAYWLDLRYQGQASVISLEWHGQDDIACRFQQAHKSRFGFALAEENIELVTVRVWLYQDIQPPSLPEIAKGKKAEPIDYAPLGELKKSAPVFLRESMVQQQEIQGPCIILDSSETLYIASNWRGEVTPKGHIYLQLYADCP